MNNSPLITTGLPIALAIIMFGLGLTLTVADFRRVARDPKAVAVALVLQILILPLLAFGLVTAFDLDPLLAVGVMLLAASSGGDHSDPVQPPLPDHQVAHANQHPRAIARPLGLPSDFAIVAPKILSSACPSSLRKI